MRFLFVNHHASAPAFGNPYRTYYLARELVSIGHKVTIVAAAWSHIRQAQPETGGNPLWTTIDGISYCFLPTRAYGMGSFSRVRNILGFLRSYRKAWREIARRTTPDVVVEGTTHILPIYTSRRIACATGATLVFESRDLWPETLIEITGASPWHPFILLVGRAQRAALKSCDGVISTLVGAEKYYQEKGLPPKAFAHIQNGIDPADFEDRPEIDSDALLGLKALHQEADAVIGYAGSIGLVNAVDILMDAAPRLAEMNVAVALIGKGERKEDLARRARAEGLDNVRFFDPVPKAQVIPVIRHFDLGFVGGKARPIHRHGVSPNKLFDYMAASAPVLFCIASPDHIVESAQCGYEMPEPTADRVIGAVEHFLALSPAERAEMGARGRSYALENFSYSVLAQRYVEAVTAMGARG
ncbi:glycosyltransferase family 4 protein [Roseovarius sp.]|uniref:glycosyltransferase family 4 protein n=1 Tax=Roseovarius sp. TaxID=1486281 RepID=UPI003511D074